jgi:uncharacterized membrane protein YuzA (DUF378 family)
MAVTLNHAERRHIPDRRNHEGVASGERNIKRMRALEWIPMLLLIVGGINWGLVGLMNLDVVATLFGDGSLVSRVIYGLVGLSALYSIYLGSRMSGSNV